MNTPNHPNNFKKTNPVQSLFSWGSAPLYVSKLHQIGHFKDAPPVIVYPGLGATDFSMASVRSTLIKKGAHCYGWEQGLNKGLHEAVWEKGLSQLHSVYAKHQRPIYLIGWSLGGIFARELAKTFLQIQPGSIAGVITLGSPINTMPTGGWIVQLYELLSRTKADEQEFWDRKLYMAPSCPTVSLYSKCDTVVPWASSVQIKAFATECKNILIAPGHLAMVRHPQLLYHVAKVIDQIEHRQSIMDADEQQFQNSNTLKNIQSFMSHTLSVLNHPELSHLQATR